MHSGVVTIKLTSAPSYTCIAELYGLFDVFKALASNGVDDAVDLRTLDALHDEVRELVRARAERVNLTNQKMPTIHWATLLLLSIATIAGFTINSLPSNPAVSSVLSAIIGFIVPLSFASTRPAPLTRPPHTPLAHTSV